VPGFEKGTSRWCSRSAGPSTLAKMQMHLVKSPVWQW
jgi:hypothetical protein